MPMRPIGTCTCLSIALLLSVLDVQVASAVVVPATDGGWYSEVGFKNPLPLNYLVGDSQFRDCRQFCFGDIRNFFVFDLSSIVTPIDSAKLALALPGPPIIDPGYISGDPSENYELHDVVTPITSLVNGTGGVAAHTDLGSGVVYGSRTMTLADSGTVT